MKTFLTFSLSLAAGASLYAAGLTPLFTFTEETKIRGPFTDLGAELYFACEKGGAANYGYLGKFDPVAGALTPLYHFAAETKKKGGLTPAGTNSFLFVGERGGTGNFGYIGRYDLTSGTLTVLHEFEVETKPKTVLQPLQTNAYYFTTDRGGIQAAGYVGRFEPGAGLSVVASLTTDAGLKIDAPFLPLNGQLYYAAREGGDVTQVQGKGAGTLGRFDPQTGTLTKLADLHAANHGAKIKALVALGTNWLYFTAEEGGDLSLNSGKGLGTLGRFNVATLELQRLLIFDGANSCA